MIVLWLLVLLVIVVVRGTDGLSSVTQQQQKPIQRVGIVGGGIAGLTLAHALLPNDDPNNNNNNNNNNIEVEVFDARNALDFEAGAGVQINGGMSVLHRINPRLQQAVVRASLPLTEIASRARPWFPNTRQTTTYDTLLQIGLDQTIRNANDETKQALIVNDQVMAYTIMRGALQETLLDELPLETQERVRFGKMLTGIRGTTSSSSSNNNEEEDGGIMLDFQDGSSAGPFDLVVGCDGIKTAVKEYIETGRISADPKQRKGSPAVYSGIRIRYAVQDADDNDDETTTAQLRQYFGNGGYALTGIYGAGPDRPPVKCAFTIVLDDDYIGPFKKKKEASSSSSTSTVVEENVSWTQDVRGSRVVRDIMLQQIEDCEIPDLELRPIVSGASRFFELGVYFHIPFSLNGWSKTVPRSGGRFCTLCGDAAHAMPPFLGQGSNQGIQDAYCLAQAILEFNNNQNNNNKEDDDGQKTFKEILKEYEQVRWAATTEISAKAAVLGYIEAGPGFVAKFRDTLFFTLGKLGIAQKVFLGAATPKVDR